MAAQKQASNTNKNRSTHLPGGRRRLRGVIHLYLRDQGLGFIQVGEREYRFLVIDIVGDVHPAEGDPVNFLPIEEVGQYRARQVMLEARIEDRLPTDSQRYAREKRPDSAELVRAARVAAPIDRVKAGVREHVRCGCCQRLVIPKMQRLKTKPGVKPRWKQSCPRCKGPVDGRKSAPRKILGATVAAVGGVFVLTRSLFF